MFTNRIADAVCWQEGMRLTPQHFQQLALRQERLQAYLLRAVMPEHWGLTTLRWHLAQTVLVIDELEGLMRDGLYVRHDANEDPPLAIDLAGKTLQRDAQGCYHIALAVLSVEAALVQQGSGRYRQQLGEVADLNAGGAPVRLATQRPLLQLACGERAGEAGLDLLPLARLEPAGNSYRSNYVPPAPRVSASSPASALHLQAGAAAHQLRERYHYYTDLHQKLSRGGNDAGAQALEGKLAALGARLPELEAMLQGVGAHPRELYQLLCGVLGALAAADPGLRYVAPPPFDYLDLQASIGGLLAAVAVRITAFHVPYERIAFGSDGQRRYTLAAEHVPTGASCYIGLRAPQRASGADMVRWLDGAKVASATQMERVEKNRLRGIGRRALELGEAARIHANSDYTVFALDLTQADAYFDAAAALQIEGPAGNAGQLAPLDIVLYRPSLPAPPGD